MSQQVGTTVTAKIVANDSKDKIATVNANEAEGGNHSYPKLNDSSDAEQPFNSLYTIPAERRKWGMFGTVFNDGANNGRYELKYNLNSTDLADNANWQIFNASGSVGIEKQTINAFGTTITPPSAGKIKLVILNVAANGTYTGLPAPTNTGSQYILKAANAVSVAFSVDIDGTTAGDPVMFGPDRITVVDLGTYESI